MLLEDLGLIGNCQCSALVHRSGAIVWSCLPRFDSAPVFGSLLDEEAGAFEIGMADGTLGQQRYLPNTNVLETRFEGPDGSFRILDFCPRFSQFGRSFRPTKIIRIVEPLRGTPRIRVRCDPRLGWSKAVPRAEQGSHHVSYHGFGAELRLSTDASLSYLGMTPFALTQRQHFVLAWDAPVQEELAPLCERFLRETQAYWTLWVKHCEIPPLYSEQVIRSALTLKLHCFEDTGAIVAAHTTSIPESPGSGRTWDYRYCWLRDAYYALGAFRLLGHFEEREQFLHYLLNIAANTPDLDLSPLYRIDGSSDLTEQILPNWRGYRGHGPVRVGNQAAEHKQHDVFGEMVLALTPMLLDLRFRDANTETVVELLTRLARKAVSVAGHPDAGIWEYRTDWRPQTFSSLMCWAAADRMGRAATLQGLPLASELGAAAARIREEIVTQAIDPKTGGLTASYGELELDAALLQAVTLRLLPPDDPRMRATVYEIRRVLSQGDWLRRYRTDDGFGVPTVAFVICSYWLVEALCVIGDIGAARELMQRLLAVRSPLGLIAEDLAPETGEMWGNFPQAYSHVGLIHAAFAASPRWAEVI